MVSNKYAIIGFGCILSKEKILYLLFKKYLSKWNIEQNRFNMYWISEEIKKTDENKIDKLDFFHGCYYYNNSCYGN